MKLRSLVCVPVLLLPLLASCATDPQGQVMLALKTDMSLPKDVDRVRIEVTYVDSGAFAYQQNFEKLGSEEGIRLPATLGFLAPESPDRAIRIRVIASRGSFESPRVLREIVTTVPQTRTALLPVPIEFLCDGMAEPDRDEFGKVKRDASGNVIVKSTCPEGLTCKTGTCAPIEVPSELLSDYDDNEVDGTSNGEGDGTCFDTAKCFDTTFDLSPIPEGGKCTAIVPMLAQQVNIGLRTQGGGMCGANGCFVALDFESEAGWKPLGGNKIELPMGVCLKADDGKVIGVVAAEVKAASCAQKRASIPPCPEESAADDPQYITTGQVNPVALGLTLNAIYWTSKGALDPAGESDGTGAVKMVSKLGGEPFVIAEKQAAPSGLVVDADRYFVLWTNEQPTNAGSIRWAPLGEPAKAAEGKVLVENLLQPVGIALSGPQLYFTEIASSKVYGATTTVVGNALDLAAGGAPLALPEPNPTSTFPRGVAAVNDTVCWTYESTLMDGNGVVACNNGMLTVAIATQQATPRAIAVHQVDPNNVAVYWANFAAMGGVRRVMLMNGVPTMPETIANIAFPAGLAIDEDNNRLYVTSRSEGRIVWVPLIGALAEPQLVVEQRNNPAAIAVDGEDLYWIEEGEPNTPTGAILKVKKP